MRETVEAHPPGAAVARSPNGASDAAQRGWAPIPLVSRSKLRASTLGASYALFYEAGNSRILAVLFLMLPP
jgi:hypothetical protein